jgi:hypothetical protein
MEEKDDVWYFDKWFDKVFKYNETRDGFALIEYPNRFRLALKNEYENGIDN